jgi:stress-induced morphogen
VSANVGAIPWDHLKTDETRRLETAIRSHYPNTEAYRYNSASIRVRVIDDAFVGKEDGERRRMVKRLLGSIPEDTTTDIMMILTMTEDETNGRYNRYSLINLEFENPSPSDL